MCKLTHGNGLASHILSDALSGLVNSSLRCDSLRSVKTQHLFPCLTTVGVQSPNVASCTLSGILFPAGVQDAANVQSEATLCARHIAHMSGKEDVISAGEGGGRQTRGDRKSKHAILLRYLCQV